MWCILQFSNKYKSKKRFVESFKKYNSEIKILDYSKVNEFLELNERWCFEKKCFEDEFMYYENSAIKETLNNINQLNIFGIGIYINNKIQAFAIGEKLNENTYVDHFEKANTEYDGIYQFLLNEFCKSIPKNYKFINREQDLGIEGLRKAKLSYHPDKIIEKFRIFAN